MALEITDAGFEDLLKSGKPLVIDFWAEWCGPCRMVGPIVEELAAEYEGKVTIGKVDVDNNDEITSKYGIRNIPTILFIKNGEIVDKQVGATQKATLVEKIENLLK
jgi:thioredoxin 1